MPPRSENVLDGWTAAPFPAVGLTHDVYTRGTGPGIVLLPEIPGMHPAVLGLGNHLVDAGFTVAIPSLFGEPGREISPGYALPTFAKACITRDSAPSRAAPTGPSPSTPAPWPGTCTRCRRPGRRRHRHVLHRRLRARRPPSSPPSWRPWRATVAAVPAARPGARHRHVRPRAGDVAERIRSDGLCLLGLRFTEDTLSPPDRFTSLERAFGKGWRAIPLTRRPATRPASRGASTPCSPAPTSTSPATRPTSRGPRSPRSCGNA